MPYRLFYGSGSEQVSLKKAIGPVQLTEDEARTTARRAYEKNLRLTSVEIGRAVGRSRQTVDSYINRSGWEHTHIIQAPLSSERFKANVVSAMQKKRILGVTSRYVIVAPKA